MSKINVLEYLIAINQIAIAIQKYGYPAVVAIVNELKDKNDPTLEEVEAILDIMKDPESYF